MKPMKEVKVYLKLKAIDEKNPFMDDFFEMLTAINDCHNMVVFLSQKEYNPADLDNKILADHKLKITNIKRENPFILELIFNIDPDQLIEFLKYLKLCFYGCGLFRTSATDLIKDIIKWLKRKGYIADEKIIEEKLKKDYRFLASKINKLSKVLCGNKLKITDLIYILDDVKDIIIEDENYKRED